MPRSSRSPLPRRPLVRARSSCRLILPSTGAFPGRNGACRTRLVPQQASRGSPITRQPPRLLRTQKSRTDHGWCSASRIRVGGPPRTDERSPLCRTASLVLCSAGHFGAVWSSSAKEDSTRCSGRRSPTAAMRSSTSLSASVRGGCTMVRGHNRFFSTTLASAA